MSKNKSSQNCRSLQFFELVDIAKQKFMCNINQCKKVISGQNNGNLVSHIKHLHPDIYVEKINPISVDKKSMELKKLNLIQACAEIVAVDGRPLNYLKDSGFQLLVQDQLDELERNGIPFAVCCDHYKELKEYIINSGMKILDRIRIETEKKLISVMTDIGFANERSILSTNIRYIVNDSIVNRNIGMSLITERHTSPVLRDHTRA